MEVDRSLWGKYSPVSATALGIAPPTPIPVRKRNAISSGTVVAVMVRNVLAPKAAVQATIMRLCPKRAENGDRKR